MSASEQWAPVSTKVQWAIWLMGLYTIFVILFGAVVRITGSGAGCGQHWPTCHGDIVPLQSSIESLIEYTHRLTSGLCLWIVIGVAIAVLRTTSKSHPARLPARVSVVFIVTEALIGAGIVLLEYVAENASYYRAAWMALHLVNTFVLMGAIGLMAWNARFPARLRLAQHGALALVGKTIVVGFMLISMTGAVSALGQTLFPALPEQTIVEHVTADPYADTPYPMLLRLVHPLLAVAVAMVMIAWAQRVADQFDGRTRTAAHWMLGFVVAQVVVGFANVALDAPGWMQLVHLGVGNGVWLCLVAVLASLGAEPARPSPAVIGVTSTAGARS
jgi:heme a synthase